MRTPILHSLRNYRNNRLLLAASWGLVVAVLQSVTGEVPLAGARPMDPSLSRMVENPNCRQEREAWPCRPNQALFHQLISQWGTVVSPTNSGGARPLGARKIQASVSASLTDIASGSEYWALGSQGRTPAAERNSAPEAFLTSYAVTIHRGFGFGLQLSGSVGFLPGTQSAIWGVDIRQGLFEGLQQLVPSYLPDISVGMGVRKITGLHELSLHTQSVDLRAARSFVIAGEHHFTPWFGLQSLRIVGESELVDFTPAIDAVAECGYLAPASLAAEELPSSVNCPGSAEDRENTQRFEESEVYRHRVQWGVDYRHDSVVLGLQLATDWLSPEQGQAKQTVENALRCTGAKPQCQAAPRQWALNVEVGVLF